MGGLLQAIVTLNWSQLPGYIGAIFSTTSTLFMYALDSVYQGILYTLYGWYIIAGYILLALASIVSSAVKVIAYIFYPIVWVVDTLLPNIIEKSTTLLGQSDSFIILLLQYLLYILAFIVIILFLAFVLPWLLRKGLVVLRKSVRIFMYIQVRVRLTVRVLCRRLLGVLIPVRNVRNRAANVPAGVNQPRDEAGGGGGHRAAVRIPHLREERELFERRGEEVVRARRTPRERGEAIERMEREARQQRRGGAMQRVPREAETGAGNQVRNVVGREARERREAADFRRRFVPQEPDYPDEWLPIGHALQRKRDVIENRERRERRRSGHEMIEHGTDMESWRVGMRDPERARLMQAEWERNGGGLAVRNGRDDSRDGPVYHGHGARSGRDYTQRINRYLERNGDSPAPLPPRQPNSARSGRDYTQRINRYLEQNTDSLPPLPPHHFNDVSTLHGGSKQSDIFNFKTPASTKSAIPGQGDMALKTKLEELEKKLQKEEESKQCVVCMDQPKELMIRPCNHYCVCQACARRLQKCPMCNGLINRAERVYNV